MKAIHFYYDPLDISSFPKSLNIDNQKQIRDRAVKKILNQIDISKAVKKIK